MINTDAMIVGGFFIGALAVPVITLLVTLLRVEVEDGEVALVTRFGRLTRTLSEPGWHWVLDEFTLGARSQGKYEARFRTIDNIQINDARGTTVVVDIWVELRVRIPKATTLWRTGIARYGT